MPLKKELVGIRKMADVKAEKVIYKVSEEIFNCQDEHFTPNNYAIHYYFKPEYQAYRLFEMENCEATRV